MNKAKDIDFTVAHFDHINKLYKILNESEKKQLFSGIENVNFNPYIDY